jgi:hypothetical protein
MFGNSQEDSHVKEKTTLKNVNHGNVLRNGFNNPSARPDFEIYFEQSKNSVRVHRFILANSSEYFDACLRLPMTESTENKLVIDGDDDEELFTNLIKCIYTGEIDIQDEDIIPVLMMAAKYQLLDQEKLLIDYLAKHVDEHNIFECLTLDTARDVYKPVLDKARTFVAKNSAKFFIGEAIGRLNFEEFLKIIETYVHAGVQNICTEMLENWISFDPENRTQHVYILLKAINKAKSSINKSIYYFDTKGLHNVTLDIERQKATITVGQIHGQVFLDVMIPHWRIKLELGSELAVGVGVRDDIISNNIHWIGHPNQYAYVVYKNGTEYRHGDTAHSGTTPMVFSIGDIIDMDYDKESNSLKITSSSGRNCTIKNLPDTGLYPFFYLGIGTTITLHDRSTM